MRVHRLTALEALRRLGLPGLGGALLLGFALAWTALALGPGLDERVRARESLARAQAQAAAHARGELTVSLPPSRLLDDFHAGLSAQPAATSDIDRLFAAADAERLSLARAEYSLVVERDTDLARYQILLPLRGDYPRVRRFLAAALDAVPALGLEDIDLQRKQVSETELDARVRMTLYLSRR